MMQHKSPYQSSLCAFMGAFLFVLMLSAAAQAAPFTAPKKLADYLYLLFRRGDRAEIDFATGKITNLTTGETLQAEPMGDYMLKILQSGGIKPLIREQMAKE